MLSRKDYMAMAEIIAECRCPNPETDIESGINQGCQDIAYRIADYCEQSRIQLDRKDFFDICFQD